ncbi:MFS general substrate transporter [Mycena crocata]|nr:MFS general substrate transporter [Mycena crocata]
MSLKLDKTGLPLAPQPSDGASDLLNFPRWLKVAILLQVSFLALLGPLNQATSPAFVPLAAHFHVTTVVARPRLPSVRIFVYHHLSSSSRLAFAGIGSFVWVPPANIYGRRPVLLFTILTAATSSLGSGEALTWSQLIATRVSCPQWARYIILFTIGAVMESDCFFLHERGRAMDIFTVLLTNSAHIAPILGGFLGQFVSYRWCYYFPAILDFTIVVVMFFCLPETLHPTLSANLSCSYPPLTVVLFNPVSRRFKYPTAVLTALYYSVTFTLASILPAVTSTTLFRRLCKFNASETGLALGIGTLVGSTLGELLGGLVVDSSMHLSRKNQKDTDIVPEVRLQAPYIGPTLGFGIMCFAIHTVLYSYNADCYKPQTPEIAQVLNFGRQTVGMTTGFWAIPLGDKIGYQRIFRPLFIAAAEL